MPSFVWAPPVESRLTLEDPEVHTLRGPRQVGKTTTVKRLIRRLLERGERRVLYFSRSNISDAQDRRRQLQALHASRRRSLL